MSEEPTIAFEATHPTPCARCDAWIPEGQDVFYLDEEYVCERCEFIANGFVPRSSHAD